MKNALLFMIIILLAVPCFGGQKLIVIKSTKVILGKCNGISVTVENNGVWDVDEGGYKRLRIGGVNGEVEIIETDEKIPDDIDSGRYKLNGKKIERSE